MNTFPIIRVKWSNEHIMAAVFGVLLLYLLPSWLQHPVSILRFLALLFFSLLIDVFINIYRYKRPICAVSAAVTAGVIMVLTPGVTLWGQLLSVLVALIFGKHIWGGTGKNHLNPAMVGLLFISIFIPIQEPVFQATILLLPAMVLSLPFIKFRPYASLGFIAGMMLAILLKQEINLHNIIAYGVIFWGCIVITDPVTISDHPIVGTVLGIIIGFSTMIHQTNSIFSMVAGVLLFNIISFLTRELSIPNVKLHSKIKIKKVVPYLNSTEFYDCTDLDQRKKAFITSIKKHDNKFCSYQTGANEILKRIQKNEVYGLGGAAFPAIEKINTVIESKVERKYLIINGVECDPGLIHDHWLIRNGMNEICRGIEYLKQCINFQDIIIALKDTKEIHSTSEIKMIKVPDYYPVGAERILIKEVLGEEFSNYEIPSKSGILVLNVQTLYTIYEAVNNKKADTKFITVADIKKQSGYVVKVKLGMRVHDIIKGLGLDSKNVYFGGGAMQCQLADEEDVIDKTLNFIAISEAPKFKGSPLCSKCGFCRGNCPAGIRVDQIAELVYKGEMQKLKRFKAEKCIQCGNCSRVCLAGRNLATKVKVAKEII